MRGSVFIRRCREGRRGLLLGGGERRSGLVEVASVGEKARKRVVVLRSSPEEKKKA